MSGLFEGREYKKVLVVARKKRAQAQKGSRSESFLEQHVPQAQESLSSGCSRKRLCRRRGEAGPPGVF
jgi:hypothetical protein